MADRGFTCQDHIGMYIAEIKMPPFTKGKKQLEKVDVDWSRELSLVRIHVEGNWRFETKVHCTAVHSTCTVL